jgi:radical SAM superfamily enzyme YgiQ (UPF0313 family)
MKALLVNPPYKIDLDDETERYFVRAGSRWPFSMTKKKTARPDYYMPFPFYLGYTAGLLRDGGVPVSVIDGVALDISLDDFLSRAEREDPDLVVYETSTPTIRYDLRVADLIKERLPNSKMVFTGPHATVLYDELLKKSLSVDFAVIGEYELAVLQLIQELQSRSPNLERIAGLAYRANGKVAVNTNVKVIDPLDELPMPAWDLFPTAGQAGPEYYWDNMCQYKPAMQLHASRGCPYRCNFCLWNQVMYREEKYRIFSAPRIADEIQLAQEKFGVRGVYFDDDTFTVNKKHVLALCDEILRRNLNIHWSCMGDAISMDEETINRMADSGCIGMKFGVESGDEEILKRIDKPLKLKNAKRVTEWCSRRGIKTHATFTFGLSGETRESLQRTLDFSKELDVDTVQFSITTPFPGTRYFEEIRSNGQLLSTDWGDYDGSSNCLVRFENVTQEEVEEFCHAFPGRWLRSKMTKPSWVLRQVRYFGRVYDGQGISGCAKLIRRGISYLSH